MPRTIPSANARPKKPQRLTAVQRRTLRSIPIQPSLLILDSYSTPQATSSDDASTTGPSYTPLVQCCAAYSLSTKLVRLEQRRLDWHLVLTLS